MKEIFTALLILIACIFLTTVLLWAAESIPLWKQVIRTMEITTGYHLTFKDYIHSSFAYFIIAIIVKLINWLLRKNEDD